MTLLFEVPADREGVKLSSLLRGQGMAMSLLRTVKYQPGGLTVDGAAAKTNLVLHAGQTVAVKLPAETGYSAAPEQRKLETLYHSPHVLVVNKPAGVVVHPTRSHKAGTLANALCGWMQAQGRYHTFRPVGRLDGDTSGPVLCAANEFAAPLLAAGLTKSYLALIQGDLSDDEGEIDAPLGPAGDSVVKQCVRPDGKPSLTCFTVLARGGSATLVRVWPKTGRTHQIRAHFAHIGHPLLGDSLYGGSRAHIQRHALHCEVVRFREPFVKLQTGAAMLQTGGRVELACPPPPDFIAALQTAGVDKNSTKLYNASNRVLLV